MSLNAGRGTNFGVVMRRGSDSRITARLPVLGLDISAFPLEHVPEPRNLVEEELARKAALAESEAKAAAFVPKSLLPLRLTVIPEEHPLKQSDDDDHKDEDNDDDGGDHTTNTNSCWQVGEIDEKPAIAWLTTLLPTSNKTLSEVASPPNISEVEEKDEALQHDVEQQPPQPNASTDKQEDLVINGQSDDLQPTNMDESDMTLHAALPLANNTKTSEVDVSSNVKDLDEKDHKWEVHEEQQPPPLPQKSAQNYLEGDVRMGQRNPLQQTNTDDEPIIALSAASLTSSDNTNTSNPALPSNMEDHEVEDQALRDDEEQQPAPAHLNTTADKQNDLEIDVSTDQINNLQPTNIQDESVITLSPTLQSTKNTSQPISASHIYDMELKVEALQEDEEQQPLPAQVNASTDKQNLDVRTDILQPTMDERDDYLKRLAEPVTSQQQPDSSTPLPSPGSLPVEMSSNDGKIKDEISWQSRPIFDGPTGMAIMLMLLAICNISCGLWAVSTHSFYPLELCSGLALILVALPPLLLPRYYSHNTSIKYSSVFLVLYGIKMVAVSSRLVVVSFPQVTMTHVDENASRGPKNAVVRAFKVLTKFVNRRRAEALPVQVPGYLNVEQDPVVPLSSLVVYEASNLLWMVLVTSPHLLATANLDIPMDKANRRKPGAEMLAILVCLAGVAIQGMVLKTSSIFMTFLGQNVTSMNSGDGGVFEIVAQIRSFSGWTESDLLNFGELLFWLGIAWLNLPHGVGSCRHQGLGLLVSCSTVVATLITWILLQNDNENNFLHLNKQLSSMFTCPLPLAVLQSATQATFLRYNLLESMEQSRNLALLQCMKVAH